MEIFSLFGSVMLKDAGVENQLDKIENKAKGTSNVFESAFGKIGNAAVKVGAILGLGMGIGSMVSAASKAQESLAQMGAVLKSTGDASGMTQKQLVDLAAAQSQVSLQSKSSNIDTENLLMTFTNLGKNVFPQCLTTVNDMSQALGQDTKSSAIQLGKALQDPIKGVTALARVGVNFTAQQKEQIKTMVAAGNTVGAQKIILAELAKEFGGSSLAASKTFGGQMIILKNNITGLGVGITNMLLPSMTSFLTWVNGNMPKIQSVATGAITGIVNSFKIVSSFMNANVVPVFKSFSSFIQANMPTIKGIISLVTQQIQSSFKNMSEVITKLIIPAFKDFINFIKPNMPQISNAIQTMNKIGQTALKGLISILTTYVIPGFKSLVSFVVANMPQIQSTFTSIFKGVQSVWNTILKPVLIFIMTQIGQVVGWVVANLPMIQQAFGNVMGAIGVIVKVALTILEGLWTVFGGALETIVSTLLKVVEDIISVVLNTINGNWKGAWSALIDICKTLLGGLGKIVLDILGGLGKIFLDMGATALGWGKGLIDQIGAGIVKAKDDLVNKVSDIAKAIKTKFESMFGIHSPSTVGFAWGGHIIQGLMNGMSNKDLSGFITSMIDKVKSTVGGVANSVELNSWIMAALGITGTSLSWLAPLGQLINFESGGNPSAVNNTDSNAKAGHSSVGLMQTIPETFATYGIPSLGGITSPIANIVAGINYIKARYGDISQTPGMLSVANGGAYKGYATGTNDFIGGMARINEAGGEIVSLPQHTVIYPHDVSMEMARNNNKNDEKKEINYNFNIANVSVTANSGKGFVSSLITYSKTHSV